DPDRVETLVVTEHGDIDPGTLGGFPDSRAHGDANLASVDRERYRFRGLRGSYRHNRSIRPVPTLRQPQVADSSWLWAAVMIEAAHLVVGVDHRWQAARCQRGHAA